MSARRFKGSLGQHLVDQPHEKIEEIQDKDGDEALEIWWTPGNKGIRENERADEKGKKAARGNTSTDDQLPHGCRGKIKMSRSAARQNHSRETKNNAARQFVELPRYPCLHRIDPLAPSPRLCKDMEHLPSEQAAMLVQLRMGHIPLRKYLHRIGKASSPMC